MDTLNRYREVIEKLLTNIAQLSPPSASIEYKTLFDRAADSYAVIALGWDRARRVHHFLVHLELINSEVWVQEDNTDLAIAEELERAGVPKSDIVLGFHPPDVRPYTDYAAA